MYLPARRMRRELRALPVSQNIVRGRAHLTETQIWLPQCDGLSAKPRVGPSCAVRTNGRPTGLVGLFSNTDTVTASVVAPDGSTVLT